MMVIAPRISPRAIIVGVSSTGIQRTSAVSSTSGSPTRSSRSPGTGPARSPRQRHSLARVVQEHRHRAAPHPEDVLREAQVWKLDIGQAQD
jgi:hypothetical protein